MTHVKSQVITEIKLLKVSSPAFANNSYIPAKYTSDKDNISPPFNIAGIPLRAKSLAIIVEDPDAPMGTWVHWVVWNIPPVKTIKENSIPGTEGLNDFSHHHYRGPCPPRGLHHYHFKFYASNTFLDIPQDTNAQQLEKALSGHILAFGELTGIYERQG